MPDGQRKQQNHPQSQTTKKATNLLRIILWKLGFEWANLKRLLRPNDDDRILYFTFGANLSPDILKERSTTVFETFDFILEDAVLRFSQSGFYKDHAFASADPAPGEKVYGKMYLIRKTDAARMDYYEGVPFLKAHDKVTSEYKGQPFYYYRARTPTENLKPTQEYLDYLTTAYHGMDCVPDEYTQAMEATEVLTVFELQTLTGKIIHDIDSWPKILHPLLTKYEAICRRLIEITWNWSLLVWLIKT